LAIGVIGVIEKWILGFRGFLRGIRFFLFIGVAGISWPDPERFVFNTMPIVYNSKSYIK